MSIKQLRMKNIDVYSMALSGLIYLTLGILFLTQKETLLFAVKSLLNLLVILFAITAVFQMIGFTPFRKKNLTSIARLFGLKLTTEQKQRVREKIGDIHQNLYSWKPKSERDAEKGVARKSPYKNYASIVYDHVNKF